MTERQVTGNKRQAGVTIRSYRTPDFERVWALHREGMLQTASEYPEVNAKYEDDLRAIEQSYLTQGSHFWVAEAGARLVGMTAITRIDAETGRLRRMRVTETWRRRGIAQTLLNSGVAFCRAQGYKRIVLDTTERQAAAHRLYEKNGFVKLGERRLGPFNVFDYEKNLR